ncbi:MAG: response regulator transcription factor [Gammaproteobacteria bacterium]|nr:response regulator transcription factor [Gammaproteobacteria bacterium]
MNIPDIQANVLWFDARLDKTDHSVVKRIQSKIELNYINAVPNLSLAIDDTFDVLVVDLDFPNLNGLNVIKNTRELLPQLPIILMIDYHQESIAVFALRYRVWDYLIKPKEIDRLFTVVDSIAQLNRQDSSHLNWFNEYLPSRVPQIACLRSARRQIKVTDPVVSYLRTNYAKRISIQEMANLCHLSSSEFCRRFKMEQKVTFLQFQTQLRMANAKKLLNETNLSITEIAFVVGYNESSHFSRVFSRQVGASPLQFRQKNNLQIISQKHNCAK